MELRTGRGYEELVGTELLTPLGMFDTKVRVNAVYSSVIVLVYAKHDEFDTKITLSPEQWAHDVAPGENKKGKFAERDTPYGVLKGQGAYHASARDMDRFLQVSLRDTNE